LTFLPPREAAWRYQRGSRSLLSNLVASGVGVLGVAAAGTDEGVGDEEDDVEVPPELEEIVEKLLCALRDKDTVVSVMTSTHPCYCCCCSCCCCL
jgi:tubulin-specific chaperone D